MKNTFINSMIENICKDIWKVLEKLRESLDYSVFKNYILGFLFYRYISEEFKNYIKNRVEGLDVDYYEYSDSENWIEEVKGILIEEKSYFIYPSQLFENLSKKLKNQEIKIENLNEELKNTFESIEETSKKANSNKKISGLFELIDFNNKNLGEEVYTRNRRIKEIIESVSDLTVHIEENDGSTYKKVYKYLIVKYSEEMYKKGFKSYTPPEVSQLLSDLVWDETKDITTVYDPACGSGSLLLKFLDKISDPIGSKLKFFGQEINRDEYNICRMNMFLHRVNYRNFDIALGDTLKNDRFDNRKFDVIVSNPPYSIKWEGSENPDFRNDERFWGLGGLAPKSNADWAFIQHSLYHLAEHGTAAIVCYPGILTRSGVEKKIREFMINNNYVDAVIQLPKKLFFGTEIDACILVLKRDKKQKEVIFIDASNIFKKAKSRNKLSDENIKEILKMYRDRKDIDYVAKVVGLEALQAKEYSLSVDSYVVKKSNEEVVDIEDLDKSITERSLKIDQIKVEIDKLLKDFESL